MIFKVQRQQNLLVLQSYMSCFTPQGIYFLPQVQVHLSNKLFLIVPLLKKIDLNWDWKTYQSISILTDYDLSTRFKFILWWRSDENNTNYSKSNLISKNLLSSRIRLTMYSYYPFCNNHSIFVEYMILSWQRWII